MTIANMEYQLIRSRRRTLSIEISREAQIIVRAPMRLPRRDIEKFLLEKQGWIHIHLERQRQKVVAHPEPDEATWQRWNCLLYTSPTIGAGVVGAPHGALEQIALPLSWGPVNIAFISHINIISVI